MCGGVGTTKQRCRPLATGLEWAWHHCAIPLGENCVGRANGRAKEGVKHMLDQIVLNVVIMKNKNQKLVKMLKGLSC